MSTTRRTKPAPVNELRAALAGLALQGLLANPDISARLLPNMDADDEMAGAYVANLVNFAVASSARLLEELSK